MFLARKISLAKWSKQSELEVGEISADAVTLDLKTQDNKLSFWRCGDGERAGVNEAALAIAAACDRIDKIDVVWLAVGELQSDGQTLKDTKGRTPVLGLDELHVDVCRLDYWRLGKVAQLIFTAIQKDQHLRLRKACVKNLLTHAAEQGRIDPEGLKKPVRKELGL